MPLPRMFEPATSRHGRPHRLIRPNPHPHPHPHPNPNPNPNPNPGPAGGARFLFDNVAISCASLRSGKEGVGALLAHSMGLGKTLTTIALIDALLTSVALRTAAREGGVAGFRCVLVVAPATVLQNWCDDGGRWSGAILTRPTVAVLTVLGATRLTSGRSARR